jgi:hypothetical protein
MAGRKQSHTSRHQGLLKEGSIYITPAIKG